jgi:hypothetical protein
MEIMLFEKMGYKNYVVDILNEESFWIELTFSVELLKNHEDYFYYMYAEANAAKKTIKLLKEEIQTLIKDDKTRCCKKNTHLIRDNKRLIRDNVAIINKRHKHYLDIHKQNIEDNKKTKLPTCEKLVPNIKKTLYYAKYHESDNDYNDDGNGSPRFCVQPPLSVYRIMTRSGLWHAGVGKTIIVN